MMQTFEVLIQNERTGEQVTVIVPSIGPEDAQVQALGHTFRERGWHTCLAFVPVCCPVPTIDGPKGIDIPCP